MKIVVLALCVFITGCSVIKPVLRDKVLPKAQEKIPKMVIKELDKMVEDGELTVKQKDKLQKLAFKLLIRLNEKAVIYLSEDK